MNSRLLLEDGPQRTPPWQDRIVSWSPRGRRRARTNLRPPAVPSLVRLVPWCRLSHGCGASAQVGWQPKMIRFLLMTTAEKETLIQGRPYPWPELMDFHR